MPNNIVSFSDATINQRGKTILKNVSIDVSEGSFVFLIGRTGSGKSSLIKTIYGDLELVGGVGNVAGYDLTRLKSRQIPNLRRELGVVFQDFKLLPDRTIDDNLKFVLKSTNATLWTKGFSVIEALKINEFLYIITELSPPSLDQA